MIAFVANGALIFTELRCIDSLCGKETYQAH